MIQTLPIKQPNEKWYAPFDFSNPLNSTSNPNASEDIGQVLALIVKDVGTGEDATSEITDDSITQLSGKIAYIWIKGGQDGHKYKITVRVEAATSKQVFELEAYLIVKEF
jgi:hypothetical protein